jgi:hypothetical protein
MWGLTTGEGCESVEEFGAAVSRCLSKMAVKVEHVEKVLLSLFK